MEPTPHTDTPNPPASSGPANRTPPTPRAPWRVAVIGGVATLLLLVVGLTAWHFLHRGANTEPLSPALASKLVADNSLIGLSESDLLKKLGKPGSRRAFGPWIYDAGTSTTVNSGRSQFTLKVYVQDGRVTEAGLTETF